MTAPFFRVDVRNFRFALKPVLIKTLTEAHREYLNRAGGFVKKYAERSMRRGSVSKRTGRRLRSKPGRPPRKYRGDLVTTMHYRIAPNNRSVAIRPKRYPGSKVADILEAGGRTTIYDYDPSVGAGIERPVTLAPRPYMNPAKEKVEPTLAKIWEDSFRIKRRGRF